MADKTVTLIIGSSRKKKNTFVFAKSMQHAFENHGYSAEIFYSINNYQGLTDSFIHGIQQSQILCILSPLYADFMPYHLLKTLELVEERADLDLKDKKLFGFSQCAFPFYRLNECSIKSMELFAKKMKMNWTGGLMYGGAGMMDCEALEEMGKKGQKMIQALDLAAEGIVQIGKVPEKSQELLAMNIPGILRRPVMWFINRNVKKIEKEVGKPLDSQAYR